MALFLSNVFSEAVAINCGVPQWMIVGPVLFLVYINDIPQAHSDSHIYLYADANKSKMFSIRNWQICANGLLKIKLSIHLSEDKTTCSRFRKEKACWSLT